MLLSLLLPLTVLCLVSGRDYVHAPIQYHTQTDYGTYNYGYDTGLYGSHQFHQEHKDASGQVRGRYGYTDPNGKLRVVYYTSGPQGFQIVSDTEPSTPTASRKPNVGTVNTIERYRSPPRTPYKPVYSRNYYRKPERHLPFSSRAVPRRKPLLSRSYRESGSENSRLYMAGRDYGRTNFRTRGRYSEERPIVRVESPRSQYHRATPTPTPPVIRYEASTPIQPISIPSRSATSNYDHLHKPYSYEVPVSAPETHIRESVSVSHVPTVHNDISEVPISSVPVSNSYPTSHSRTITHSAPVSLPAQPVPPYAIPPVAIPAQPYSVRPPVVYSGRGILSPSARLKLGLRNAQSARVERSFDNTEGNPE